jgi:hypothetical protein
VVVIDERIVVAPTEHGRVADPQHRREHRADLGCGSVVHAVALPLRVARGALDVRERDALRVLIELRAVVDDLRERTVRTLPFESRLAEGVASG